MNRSKWDVFIITLLLGILCVSAYAQEPANFRGVWDMEETGGLSFGLELSQDGNELSGHHCGITDNADRVDCSLAGEDAPSITGSIQGNVAKVRFTSAYSGQIGMAKLTLSNDSLLWEITAYPNGEYYLPDQAVLIKSGDISGDAIIIDDERLERLATLISRDLQSQSYPYPVRIDNEYTTYADLNNDSIDDVVTIFYAFDTLIDAPDSVVRVEDRFLAIGFGSAAGEFTLALNAQAVPCLDCGGMYGEPEIGVTIDAGVITLSSFGGSNWRWEHVQKIRYEDHAFKVIGYTENAFHTGSGLTMGYDLNLNTLKAVRNYTYGEDGKEQENVAFRTLMVNHAPVPITIDGILNEAAWLSAQTTTIRQASDIVYKPENWSGAADLSFAAATLWDAAGLYIGIVAEDDRVVPVDSWDGILKGDHLELWLDVADSLVQWDVEGWPLRRKPDKRIMQIGVGIPVSGTVPVVRALYPEQPEGSLGITAAAAPTETGYILEVAIPRAVIDALALEETAWEWTTGLSFGLSLVLSDTDDPQKRRQDCLMATSAVQWGTPYTLGAGHLVETYTKPDVPLQGWRARY